MESRRKRTVWGYFRLVIQIVVIAIVGIMVAIAILSRAGLKDLIFVIAVGIILFIISCFCDQFQLNFVCGGNVKKGKRMFRLRNFILKIVYGILHCGFVRWQFDSEIYFVTAIFILAIKLNLNFLVLFSQKSRPKAGFFDVYLAARRACPPTGGGRYVRIS